MPDAITLDLRLPDIDGWVLLDQLKHDSRTRHIPVHLISAVDDAELRALEHGALAFVQKSGDADELRQAPRRASAAFLDKRVKHLLARRGRPDAAARHRRADRQR